jgi:hypothetical protein
MEKKYLEKLFFINYTNCYLLKSTTQNFISFFPTENKNDNIAVLLILLPGIYELYINNEYVQLNMKLWNLIIIPTNTMYELKNIKDEVFMIKANIIIKHFSLNKECELSIVHKTPYLCSDEKRRIQLDIVKQLQYFNNLINTTKKEQEIKLSYMKKIYNNLISNIKIKYIKGAIGYITYTKYSTKLCNEYSEKKLKYQVSIENTLKQLNTTTYDLKKKLNNYQPNYLIDIIKNTKATTSYILLDKYYKYPFLELLSSTDIQLFNDILNIQNRKIQIKNFTGIYYDEMCGDENGSYYDGILIKDLYPINYDPSMINDEIELKDVYTNIEKCLPQTVDNWDTAGTLSNKWFIDQKYNLKYYKYEKNYTIMIIEKFDDSANLIKHHKPRRSVVPSPIPIAHYKTV